MKIEKTQREKKEKNFLGTFWPLIEKFFSSLVDQVEKKIQVGAEEAGFFLRKKLVIGILLFWGSGFFLVGIALALDKILAEWGMIGWGWLLTGGICWLLASLVNGLKK